MTVAPMFKTPASSPPKYPSTPLATTPTQQLQTPSNAVAAVVTALVTDKLIGCCTTVAGASSGGGTIGPLSSKCSTMMMGSEHDVRIDVVESEPGLTPDSPDSVEADNVDT